LILVDAEGQDGKRRLLCTARFEIRLIGAPVIGFRELMAMVCVVNSSLAEGPNSSRGSAALLVLQVLDRSSRFCQ
jgi:hypothetical protein